MSYCPTRLAILISAVAMAASGASAAHAECGTGPVSVRLPTQRLDQRLQELSRLTGCFVDVSPVLVTGKRAPAIDRRLRTDQVFFRSVQGTGLEAGPTRGHWRISRDQQDYFAGRVAALKRRLAAQPHAGLAGERQAKRNGAELDRLTRGVADLVRKQGFLSSAERSSYKAILDRVDRAIPR